MKVVKADQRSHFAGRRKKMFDFLRRCFLIVMFVLTIGLLFIGGNREKLKSVVLDKNFHELKMVSNR